MKPVFCSTSVPPSARSTLLLVTPAVVLMISGAPWVAENVPLLISAMLVPAPIWPEPRIDCPAPTVSVAPMPKMRLAVVLDICTEPLPFSDTTPSINRSVALPADCREITPLLVLLPRRPSDELFEIVTAPALLTVVDACAPVTVAVRPAATEAVSALPGVRPQLQLAAVPQSPLAGVKVQAAARLSWMGAAPSTRVAARARADLRVRSRRTVVMHRSQMRFEARICSDR